MVCAATQIYMFTVQWGETDEIKWMTKNMLSLLLKSNFLYKFLLKTNHFSILKALPQSFYNLYVYIVHISVWFTNFDIFFNYEVSDMTKAIDLFESIQKRGVVVYLFVCWRRYNINTFSTFFVFKKNPGVSFMSIVLNIIETGLASLWKLCQEG